MTNIVRDSLAAFMLGTALLLGLCVPGSSVLASQSTIVVSEPTGTIDNLKTINAADDMRTAESAAKTIQIADSAAEKNLLCSRKENTSASAQQIAETESEDASKSAASETTLSTAQTTEATKQEDQQWQNKLLPVTDEYLNVYEEASADSNVVGKLYTGDEAVIVEAGENWTKITSGNVEGYVETASCVTGSEAKDYAETQIGETAVVHADRLNVREEASISGKVVASASEGKEFKVDSTVAAVDGWVAVICNDQTCYVSADYVEVGYHFGTGVTIEEEEAAEANAIAATDEDRTLLAAIIECEAGGTGYDGCLAVASVILNRVASDSFPNTINDVVYQRSQFSPASSGFLASKLASGSVSETSYQAADDAIAGARNTDCLYFNSAWTGHSGTVIGGNVFF